MLKHTLRLIPAIVMAVIYMRYSTGQLDGLSLLLFLVTFGSVLWTIDGVAKAQYEAALDAELEAYFAGFGANDLIDSLAGSRDQRDKFFDDIPDEVAQQILEDLKTLERSLHPAQWVAGQHPAHNAQDPDCVKWIGDQAGFDMDARCVLCTKAS